MVGLHVWSGAFGNATAPTRPPDPGSQGKWVNSANNGKDSEYRVFNYQDSFRRRFVGCLDRGCGTVTTVNTRPVLLSTFSRTTLVTQAKPQYYHVQVSEQKEALCSSCPFSVISNSYSFRLSCFATLPTSSETSNAFSGEQSLALSSA